MHGFVTIGRTTMTGAERCALYLGSAACGMVFVGLLTLIGAWSR